MAKVTDLMKSLYESAFNYITKQIDKRIDAINAEKDAAVSALEAERDARLEAIEAQKEQLENEIEGIEKEIEAKEKEIKAMQDANEERKRSLDLQKAEYELQRMQNQKTSLVYKDGQVSYEADTSGIRDAKQEVEDAKLEIDISKIEKEIGLLEEQKDLLQEQIDLLDKEADRVNDYYDKLIAGTEKQYDAMVKGMEEYRSQFEELLDLFENARLEATLSELGVNMDALLNGSQEEFEKMKGAYIGILADMSRGDEEMIGQLSRLVGVNAESVSYLESTKGAFDKLGSVTLVNDITFHEISDEGYAQKLRGIAQAFGEIASKCGEFKKINFSSIIGSASAPSTDGAVMSGGEGMEGTAGTGFLGLASAISEAVASIDEQMGKLKTALDLGNSYFTGQIDVINEKYIPAWENLRTYQMMKKFEEYFAANKDAFIKPANAMVKEFVDLIKTHEHKYDRTFASTIKGINKDNTYTIMDDGGVERKVKCSIPNADLKTGQYVWVKIPSGKIEEMHICGLKLIDTVKNRTI